MKDRCCPFRHNLASAVAVAVLSLILVCSRIGVAEQNDKVLVTAGPSWDGFTNTDGSGLYHEIIRNIFRDYTVSHIYVPTVQALSMVAIGRADIKLCETVEKAPLMMAAYPMYENTFHVVYLRTALEAWKGEESLKGRKLVWREGYYSQADFGVPVEAVEVRSGESALKMVIHGRADYYVDDLRLIRQSFEAVGEQLDPKKYGIERVGSRKYFPVFARTKRGKMLRHTYEAGMKRLYERGDLQKIFKRWNFPIPHYSFAAGAE